MAGRRENVDPAQAGPSEKSRVVALKKNLRLPEGSPEHRVAARTIPGGGRARTGAGPTRCRKAGGQTRNLVESDEKGGLECALIM